MSWIHVQTHDAQEAFEPGDTVRGEVDWSFDRAPERVELRLFWRTTGKGDEDLGIGHGCLRRRLFGGI